MKPKNEFKGKEYPDLISVIIPLYKSFDPVRARICIDSLKKQKKVNLQIVVAEQSVNPALDKETGISYIFIPDSEPESSHFAVPGKIRNTAAKLCSGVYLYNSDGDIVYSNPFYFAEILELIKTGQDIALYRPPMRRLPIEDFDFFKENWEEQGLQRTLAILDDSQGFTVRKPGSNVFMVFFKKKESGKLKTFLYSNRDYERYRNDISLKGSEPQYSTLNVHAGGTLMQKKHFDEVGGFCLKFAGWGCQDADLQWKLKKKFDLIELPNSPEYEVIHLDHERGYFDKKRWQANREIQQRRRQEGVESAIKEDTPEYASL